MTASTGSRPTPRLTTTCNSPSGDVHIREIVKYTNYKRFGANVKITYEGQELPKGQGDQQPPGQPQAQQQKPPK